MITRPLLLAILVAAVVTSLTDWFFMGILFHERYKRFPEVWRRPAGGAGETQAIVWSTVIGLVTCAAFIFACAIFHLAGYCAPLKLAVLAWLIGPLPLTITNAFFIKLDPLIVASHSLGWLVKLAVAALAFGWLVR